MSIDRSRVEVGMQVVANAGVMVGRVVALDPSNFIVERPDLPAVAIPYSEIAGISAKDVRVALDASRIDKHGTIVPEHGSRPLAQENPRPGMVVLGMDGDRIGEVVDVQPDYITVDTGLTTQRYYIPSGAIEAVDDGEVTVAGIAGAINRMGWSQPPVAGNRHTFTLRPGMTVVGSDGDRVGEVAVAADYSFTVKRDSASAFHIPYAAVQEVTGGRVVLNVPDEQVHEFGWDTTPKVRRSRVPGQPVVRQGMEVVGADGDHVGVVASAGQDDCVVRRDGGPELRVPYGYVRDATVNRVVLSVTRTSVPYMHWEQPAEDVRPS